MSNKKNLSLIILSALVAVGAAALYVFSLSLNDGRYKNASNTVRQIQHLDATWSMEAIKVQSNPQSDFDGLAAFVPKLTALKTRLNDLVITDENIPERLANSTNSFVKQLEAKEEKIERFKSGFAIIRNSERYLPLASRGVMLSAQSENLPQISNTVSQLAEDISKFIRMPSDVEHKRLEVELERLEKLSGSLPLELASEVAGFESHAQVLLDNALKTELVLNEATSEKSVEKAASLVSGFESMAGKLEQKQEKFQYISMGTLGMSAVLAMFVAMFKGTAGQQSGAAAGQRASGSGGYPGSSSLDGSDVSYRVLAGLIIQDVLKTLGVVKTSMDTIHSKTADANNAFSRVQVTIDNLERGLLSKERALSELKSDLESHEDNESDSESISNAVVELDSNYQQVYKAVKQVNDYAKGEPETHYEWVSINDLVREIVSPASYNNQAQIDIRLGDVPHVYASADEIRYMFKNIVDNALEAIKLADREDGCLKVQTQVQDSQIGITITDNGVGLTPEKRKALPKLFKPNTPGKIDLGFPAVNYIVKKYGGKILMNSIPEKGTAVRVLLPESEQVAV